MILKRGSGQYVLTPIQRTMGNLQSNVEGRNKIWDSARCYEKAPKGREREREIKKSSKKKLVDSIGKQVIFRKCEN